MLSAFIFAAGLMASPIAAQEHLSQSSSTVPLRVLVALVLPDMVVRPVPLHSLELISAVDSTQRYALRTGLDGTAQHRVVPGRYHLRSIRPATLHDSTYAWSLTLEVPAGGSALELTNANASVTVRGELALARGGIGIGDFAAPSGRQIAPERAVFERVRGGVFRIEAGLGHGTGFLIDTLGGLVVTNEHVISGQTRVTVQLDTITRVPAQVVVRDAEADLALIRIPMGRCQACPRLPLAAAASGEPLAVAGERILAIGYPLSQEITLTSGIASSIREGAIISDVNINPGNSGGPLLNLAGEVVAVNTFLDPSRTVGAGVAGSVTIHRLASLFARAPAALAALPPLEERVLPSMPRDRYLLPLLKAFADTANARAYSYFANRNAGRFTVSLSLPTQQMVFARYAEAAVAGDRRRREQRAGISAEEAYSEMKEQRDWLEYVGDQTMPVVAVTVNPKIGETGSSAFGRALAASFAGVAVQAQYKFQGDVRAVRFYRNGVEVEPLRGGHVPQRVLVENQWVALKDVADMGYYLLAPEAFAPDADGTPPRVTVVIQDLKNPAAPSSVDFYDGTSARVWNDFYPYFATSGRLAAWRAADPQRPSPRVLYDCRGQTETCVFQPPSPR